MGWRGRRVFHGAADNALGVAEMLAVAEAFTKSATRPRRSVVFLAVTGEEYGLVRRGALGEEPDVEDQAGGRRLQLRRDGTEIHGPLKKAVGFGMEHSDLGAAVAGGGPGRGVEIIARPDARRRSRSTRSY